MKQNILHNIMIHRYKLMLLCLLLLTSCGFLNLRKYTDYQSYLAQEEEKYILAETTIKSLYSNYEMEIPKDNLSTDEIKDAKKVVKKVSYKEEKKDMLTKLDKLNDYLNVKEQVDECFENDILKSSVDDKKINTIKNSINKLNDNFKPLFTDKIVQMDNQYNQIKSVEQEINSLFNDSDKTTVKEDINRDRYNQVLAQLNELKQDDIKANSMKYLDLVNTELTKREEAERRRIEEERRREEQRKIAESWTKLNVPYISQNNLGVYNGCEVASLLMGLQYKGYLTNVSLYTFADNVPKSDDPYQGFRSSIYDLEPKDVLHWIAPSPLASYGRNSSGNGNVVDISGASLNDLAAEIQANNPVVIYLTASMKAPKENLDGAPRNMHVQLLTGYNSYTNEFIVTDPWTSGSRTSWQLSYNKLNQIYEGVGRKAVVIR